MFPDPYQITEEDANGGIGELAKNWGVTEDAVLAANQGMSVVPPKGTMVMQPMGGLPETPQLNTSGQGFIDTMRNLLNKPKPTATSPLPKMIQPKAIQGPPAPPAQAPGVPKPYAPPTGRGGIQAALGGVQIEIERAANAFERFQTNLGLTGQADYSLLPPSMTTTSMMKGGLQAADMQALGYVYNPTAYQWEQPGTGPAVAGGGQQRTSAGELVSYNEKGTAFIWKRKKNGKFEKVVAKRKTAAQNRPVALAPETVAANVAGQPINVLQLRMGSG